MRHAGTCVEVRGHPRAWLAGPGWVEFNFPPGSYSPFSSCPAELPGITCCCSFSSMKKHNGRVCLVPSRHHPQPFQSGAMGLPTAAWGPPPSLGREGCGDYWKSSDRHSLGPGCLGARLRVAAYGVSLCHPLEEKGWLTLEQSLALQHIRCHPATVTTLHSVPSHPLSQLCLVGFVLYPHLAGEETADWSAH